jgi:flagellar motor switch/type III secretory pathway protein FliN
MSTPSIAPAAAPVAVPVAAPAIVSEEIWEEAAWLPCVISVDLPVKHFTVRDLLRLELGAIVETDFANGADVPVVVNTQVIGWAELEIVGQSLGVRMTELA